MKHVQKLLGKRVYLSPMSIDDADTYVRWLNDFRVTDGTGSSSRMLNLPAEQKWITQNLESLSNTFAIVRLEDDKLLGNCSIHDISSPHRSATVGLLIGDKENRGRGYGTEALKLLVSYGFFYLNLHNIMLQVFSFNESAINAYQKIGFKEIGRRRECYYLNGTYYDQLYMDILKAEFPESAIENSHI